MFDLYASGARYSLAFFSYTTICRHFSLDFADISKWNQHLEKALEQIFDLDNEQALWKLLREKN